MHNWHNFVDACDVVNKVLPNLDTDMWKIDLLSMVIDREILWRFARIRFIVARHITGGAKTLEKDFRDDRVLIHSTPISTARDIPLRTGVKL